MSHFVIHICNSLLLTFNYAYLTSQSTANFKKHFITFNEILTLLDHGLLFIPKLNWENKQFSKFHFVFYSRLQKETISYTRILTLSGMFLSLYILQKPSKLIHYLLCLNFNFPCKVLLSITQQSWKHTLYLYWYFNFPIKSNLAFNSWLKKTLIICTINSTSS